MASQQIEIQSSRIPDSTRSNIPLDPENALKIQACVLASGGKERIEQAMEGELRKTGWINDVREYARALLRSGEAATFDEMMTCFKRDSKDTIGRDESTVVNGDKSTSHADGLTERDKQLDDLAARIKLPENVYAAGVNAVNKELENVVVVSVDDFGGGT